MTVTAASASQAGARPRGGRRLPLSWVGLAPFGVYVGIFLLLPTVIVAIGAFVSPDGFTLGGVTSIGQGFIVTSYVNSIVVSALSALIGAVGGALLAYAVVLGNPQGVLRRVVSSAISARPTPSIRVWVPTKYFDTKSAFNPTASKICAPQ